jgi:hypothetical protein
MLITLQSVLFSSLIWSSFPHFELLLCPTMYPVGAGLVYP